MSATRPTEPQLQFYTCVILEQFVDAHLARDPHSSVGAAWSAWSRGAVMWWLTYLRSGKMAGVVVIEAPSLIDARMRAALEAVEAGVDFAEGHEIDAARSALVPPERLERLLSIEEANRLTTIPRQDHRAAQWLSLRRRGDRLDAGLFVMGNDRLTASLGIFTSR
jgi:hypothetical protein